MLGKEERKGERDSVGGSKIQRETEKSSYRQGRSLAFFGKGNTGCGWRYKDDSCALLDYHNVSESSGVSLQEQCSLPVVLYWSSSTVRSSRVAIR